MYLSVPSLWYYSQDVNKCRMSEIWSIVGSISTGIGALATAWMAWQTKKSNKNATEAISDGKKEAFFDMVVASYSNSRKVIEQMSIIGEDCTTTPKPFGLECLGYLYDKRFKAELTITRDRSLPLSKQKEVTVIPTINEIGEKYKHIVHERYPNIGIYLSSVVTIIGMIDAEKIPDKEFKDKCVTYIKSMMTTYERLWLYYYNLLGYDKEGLLNKYNVLNNIPQNRLIALQ